MGMWRMTELNWLGSLTDPSIDEGGLSTEVNCKSNQQLIVLYVSRKNLYMIIESRRAGMAQHE